MNGWKTLRLAIPSGAAKAVAARLGVSPDHIRRLRREPLSDDAPLATGQKSIVDRHDDLIDAIFLSSPSGPAFLIEHAQRHYDELIGASLDPNWDKRQHAARTLRETIEAVNALNLDTADSETVVELLEARVAIDEAIRNLRARRERQSADLSARTTGGRR